MNILNHELQNEMIILTTNNWERPEFVYKADKFDSLENLTREIEKSIALENKRKDKKEKKLKKLKGEL